ncbi:hypothetical protein [Actinoplanes derwentensis]|uniref:Secreted protein n=1 Tax=Actinoplanes derwentensis TaxID=113562 RepID=A0A1H1TP68_9ACTN|nr:hypothetical protein [Actinoplanes derwentensis]GID85097.1 hypothetical protein Ade03nite_40210 [Actinoplanes derwentensis]SDS62125.1 hypothetical protein SAMN04489716_1202 [Actinoplanes derwentensis]
MRIASLSKRVVAVILAGLFGATALASPALAVAPTYSDYGAGSILSLYNDAGLILVGRITVTAHPSAGWNIEVCDTLSDGYVVTGRFDAGASGVVAVSTTTYGQCLTRHFSTINKYRLAWKDYATGWYLP